MQTQLFFDTQKEAALFFYRILHIPQILPYNTISLLCRCQAKAKVTHYFPHSLQSKDYDEEYTSYPLAVTLQQRLYFQVSVDTPDKRLGISADFCYATPMNSLSQKTKYDIILDGSVPTVVAISSTCY